MINRRFFIILLPILVVIFFITSSILNAQSVSNSLPDCTTSEIVEVISIFNEGNYLQDFQNIAQRFTRENISQLPNLIGEIHDLQSSWWNDAVPKFPNCAYATQFSLAFGRLVDEFMISALLVQGQLNFATTNTDLFQTFGEMTSEHTESMSAAGNEVTALLNANEIAQPTQVTGPVGDSRLSPVPIRQSHELQIFDRVLGQVEILQYDNNALETVLAADDSNESPPNGFRYVRALVRFTCGFTPDKSCEFTIADFVAVGDMGIVYDSERIEGLHDEVVFEIFGGAEIEFHLVYVVTEDDQNIVIFNDDDDRVYFATK